MPPRVDFPAASVWNWSSCYEGAVEGGFDQLAETLARDGGTVTWETRAGDPATVLMNVAAERGSDLLAIGSDGYICNGRVVVGRVAREILAHSSVAVLATPVTAHEEGEMTEIGAAQSVS